jgi:hypothetical protein
LVVFSGCATDNGATAVPGPDNAELVVTAPVWVHSIDGKKVSNGLAGEKHFTIAPGPHTILVKYSDVQRHYLVSQQSPAPEPGRPVGYINELTTSSPVRLRFIAEAGHTYYVKDGYADYEWNPHIAENRDPVFQDLKAP